MSNVFLSYGTMHAVHNECVYHGQVYVTAMCGVTRHYWTDKHPAKMKFQLYLVYDAYPTCLKCAIHDVPTP